MPDCCDGLRHRVGIGHRDLPLRFGERNSVRAHVYGCLEVTRCQPGDGAHLDRRTRQRGGRDHAPRQHSTPDQMDDCDEEEALSETLRIKSPFAWHLSC
eukprot:4341755-Prymnesium_polylepis.1